MFYASALKSFGRPVLLGQEIVGSLPFLHPYRKLHQTLLYLLNGKVSFESETASGRASTFFHIPYESFDTIR
jgi:hypothetical protein